MEVEDHPLEYGEFEGVIPPKQYGAGTVMLWDRGTWTPKSDPKEGYAKGHLKFELNGEKLKGGWNLVRSRSGKYGEKSRILLKALGEVAQPGSGASNVGERTQSEGYGRSLGRMHATGAGV